METEIPTEFSTARAAGGRFRLLLCALLFAVVIVTVICVQASLEWIGRPFSGFLMGENRIVAPIDLPGWSGRKASVPYWSQRVVEKAIDSDATVLINGETGTGKEIIARAIHYNGPRRNRRFIAQNCSSLPEALLESELFGHTRGSFTGAVKDHRGLFEEADGGTLFLDEIGDMPMSMQVKLLRVLEEGEVRRIGSSEPRRVDVRILSATHRNLREKVEVGRFRRDLYYRLDVLRIHLPPLREREDDIVLLARHFLEKYESRAGKKLGAIAPRALHALREHPFPGNVRELENEIERAVALANPGQVLDIDLLWNEVVGEPELVRMASADGASNTTHSSLRGRMREIERRMITQELLKNNGNRTHSAAKLGISVRALQKKIHLLGIKA